MTRPEIFVWGRLASLALLLSSCFPQLPLGEPGRRDSWRIAELALPGVVFNAAALNARFEHHGLSIDTKVGARKRFDRSYDTATRAWHASWETRYDGATFVDPDGSVYPVAALAPGAAVPGSIWVRVDDDTLKTRGGLVFDFDATGRLAAEHWSFGSFPQLAYHWGPDALRVEECASQAQQQAGACRALVRVVYGAHGPVEVIDLASEAAGASRRVAYAYDAQGRLREAWSARQQAEGMQGTRYAYGAANLLTAQTLPGGERIEYVYAQTHLFEVRQRGAGDPVHRLGYARTLDAGWEVVHTAPLGGRTVYRVTAQRETTRIERLDLPQPEAMEIDWHPGMLRPSRIRAFDGSVREFPSWVDDEPTRIVLPSGNTLRIAYAPGAVNLADPTRRAIATLEDDLGMLVETAYDAAGLPESRSNGEGETTSFSFLAGNLVGITSPWGDSLELTRFGAAGHWLDAQLSSFPDAAIHRAFDRVGNPIVRAPGARVGGALGRRHDADPRLEALEIAATDGNGAVGAQSLVMLARDAEGRVGSIVRPLGADHLLEYDALGRPLRRRERVDGAWRDTLFEHDAEGRPTAFERPNGMREEFDYDPYGRITARRALRHGVLEGEATFRWQAGRLVEVYDSLRGESESFAYDAAGRPISITWSARGEVLALVYDARSRTTQEIYLFDGSVRMIGSEWDLADRRVRRFTLDAAGAPQELQRWLYAQGRLVSVEYGNGLLREHLFDVATGRPRGTRTTDAGGGLVEQTDFGVELAAAPTRVEVSSETWTALAHTKEVYWLSAGGSLATPEGRLGRRVFRWQGFRDGALEAEDAWAWDGLGNPLDDALGDVFTYDSGRSRLLSASAGGVSHAYAWDEAGFATSRDGLPLEWTATGRLRRVGPAGSPLVEIGWDMAGRVVSLGALGQTRSLALFGGRVAYDPLSGSPGELHAGDASLPFSGSARRYRHYDALGNLSFASDETGAVTLHKRYHAFGVDAVYGSDDFARGEPRGFVGGVELRHQGVETGLVVLGERILDSDVGRFLSPDPLLQLTNQYGYAEGNPVEKLDASGRHVVSKAEAQEMSAALGQGAAQLDAISSHAGLAAGTLAFAASVAFMTGNGPMAGVFGAAAAGAGLVSFTASYFGDVLRALQASVESLGEDPRPPPDGPQQKRLEIGPEPRAGSLPFARQLALQSFAPAPDLRVGVGGVGCSPAAGVAGPSRFGTRWRLSGLLLGLLLSLRVAARLERRAAGDPA